LVTLSNRTWAGFPSLNLNEIDLNYVPFVAAPYLRRQSRHKEQGPYCPFFRYWDDEEEATVRSPLEWHVVKQLG